MFITELFIIANLWKQSKCPLTDGWMKKIYMCTIEYYSAVKKMNACHLRPHG